MSEGFAAKTGVSALLTFASLYVQEYGVLLWIMVGFSLLDYITGITAAVKNTGLTSQKALWGAVKKVCYFVMVTVAFGVDYLIVHAAGLIGFSVDLHPVCTLAMFYLIMTESISILENLAEIGVEVPLLSRLTKVFRDKIDRANEKNERSS